MVIKGLGSRPRSGIHEKFGLSPGIMTRLKFRPEVKGLFQYSAPKSMSSEEVKALD